MSRHTSPTRPLDLSALQDEVDGDATVFIRIPPAQRRRARLQPAERVGPPPPPEPRMGTRPPPPPPAPTRSLPASASHGIPVGASPMHRAPASQATVSGAPSPFQVSPATPIAPSPGVTADPRLYAMIVACCATVCAGLAVTLLVAVGPKTSIASDVPGPGVEPPGPGIYEGDGDTGDWDLDGDAELDAQPEPKPVVVRNGSSSGASGGSGVATTIDRPAPALRGGTLTVHLPDPRGVTSVAVDCPSGFTARSSYGDAPHVLPDVPGESCTLWFRGASPYKFVGAVGGQSLTCSFEGHVALCR